jgi:hypothetical protein
MILFSLVNVLIQSMAALLIFVVGYLVLILCVVAGLTAADLIYKGVRLAWLRASQHSASGDALSAKVAGAVRSILCQVDIFRHRAAPPRRIGA